MANNESTTPQAGWTRGRVARELEMSVTSVRRLEASGRLRPIRATPGATRLFAPEDVEEYRRSNRVRDGAAALSAPADTSRRPEVCAAGSVDRPRLDGALTSAIFDWLASGASPADVVTQLELPPDVVDTAANWFERLRGRVDGDGIDPLFVDQIHERLCAVEHMLAALRVQIAASAAVSPVATCPHCGSFCTAAWLGVASCCGAPVVMGAPRIVGG